MEKRWLMIASTMCMVAVAAGAFGAHGLKQMLTPEKLDTFEVGVRYLMFHGLALLALARPTGPWQPRLMNIARWLLALGAIFFALTLFVYAPTAWRAAAMAAPIGGTTMIVGWAVALAALGTGKPQA